jgi:ankyrin repeat protein
VKAWMRSFETCKLTSRWNERAMSRRRTALHIAAEGDKAGCITILIKYGASVTEVDQSGQTPAAIAVQGGKSNAARLLKVLPNPSMKSDRPQAAGG